MMVFKRGTMASSLRGFRWRFFSSVNEFVHVGKVRDFFRPRTNTLQNKGFARWRAAELRGWHRHC
jgi:hypothetical protein